MDYKLFCVVLGVVISSTQAGPVVEVDNSVHSNEYSTVEGSLLKKLNSKCTDHEVSSCMMLKLITYFNRILKKSSIEIGDIEITQTSIDNRNDSSARSLNIRNMSDEAQFTQLLSQKAITFLKERSLKWKILDETDLLISGGSDKKGNLNLEFSFRPSKSFEGRRKKNNNMGALIAAAALKIGLLKALAFKGLALLVGKALLVSKLALVLAVVIGLKKLFSHGKQVTYEVVAHPQHETHQEHSFSSGGGGHETYGGSGWSRNFNAGDLVYHAHTPTK